MDPQRSHRG